MIYNFKFLIVANSVAVPDFYHALVGIVFHNLLQECFFFYFPSKGIIRQKKNKTTVTLQTARSRVSGTIMFEQ